MTREQLNALKDAVLKLVDLLDSRKMSADEMKERLDHLPPREARAVKAWVDLAVAIHEAPKLVTEPRYRKGTGRKPVAWADCLWQPTG